MAPSTLLAAVLTTFVAGTSGLKVDVPGFPGATVGPGFISVPVSTPKRDSLLRKRADVAGTTDVQITNFRSSNYVIDSQFFFSSLIPSHAQVG